MMKILKYLLIAALIFSPLPNASAGWLPLVSAGGGGGGTPTYTFLAAPAFQAGTGGAGNTFLSQPLGTVGANNYTVVGIQMENGASGLSVTIGGSAATVYNPGVGGTAVAWALTPSTTGDIIVTNAGTSGIFIQVAQITNVTQIGTPTSNTAFGVQSGTWNVGSGVAIPTNGIAFVTVFLGTSAGTAVTVSGMTNDSLPVTDAVASEAFSAHTTTSGTVTPTVTFSGNGTAAIVVFGP